MKQNLAAFRGEIVVLSFWATWCGPCQKELPRLSALAQKYADRGVEFIAVSIDDPKDRGKIQPFLIKNNIQMKIWVGADSETLKAFGLGEIVPGTVVLDVSGEPMGRIMGEAQGPDIESRLNWLLNDRKGTRPEAITKRY